MLHPPSSSSSVTERLLSPTTMAISPRIVLGVLSLGIRLMFMQALALVVLLQFECRDLPVPWEFAPRDVTALRPLLAIIDDAVGSLFIARTEIIANDFRALKEWPGWRMFPLDLSSLSGQCICYNPTVKMKTRCPQVGGRFDIGSKWCWKRLRRYLLVDREGR